MPKAASKGKGRGRGRGADCVDRKHSVTAPKLTTSSFLAKNYPSTRCTSLSKPEECAQLVNWMAADTSTKSSVRSSPSSHEAGPHNTQPVPPSSLHHHHHQSYDKSIPQIGISEELFTHYVEEECSDAQTLEHPRPEEMHVQESKSVCQHMQDTDDDDETQLPSSLDPNMATQQEEVQIEEVEEVVVDDEATDPTWQAGAHSDGHSSDEQDGFVAPTQPRRGRGLTRGRTRASVPPTTPTRLRNVPRGRTSIVWDFFKQSPSEANLVVCQICQDKLSRGSTHANWSTTSMRRHLKSKHPSMWAANQVPSAVSEGQTTAPSPVLRPSQCVVQEAGAVASCTESAITATPQSVATSTSLSQGSFQLSVPQMFSRKKKYLPDHPQAKKFNARIARMLSLEMLPFRLVETESFRDLLALADPKYCVPSRHYFSRQAVPALHGHVVKNISHALSNAVTGKVHLTTDTWTSSCGQGRYISLTAHWVNLVEAGTESTAGTSSSHILPTPRIAGPTSVRVSLSSYASSSYSSSSSTPREIHSSPSIPSRELCSTGSAKRQQALLKLICLGDKSHNAAELLKGITEQTDLWLSQHSLQPGMVVCDNGRNLVAALKLGNLVHVPCMAHVLNLVVQRFLKTYPEMPDLLTKVRRVSAHFRKSSPAFAALAGFQKRFELPRHRLICDLPTRWNSTLHMLARFSEQQRALAEFQLVNARFSSTQPPSITPVEWVWIADICEVLKNFEYCTNMVSGDDTIISVTIPLICMLKRSLQDLKEEALSSQRVAMDPDLATAHTTQASVIQYSLGTLGADDEEQTQEEDEEEEEFFVRATAGTPNSRLEAVDESWLEGDDDEEEEEVEVVRMGFGFPVQETEILSFCSLAHMADFMYQCLCQDPRIKGIESNMKYWICTFLDPRYKQKFATLVSQSNGQFTVNACHKAVVQELMDRVPSDNTGGRGSASSHPQELQGRETHTGRYTHRVKMSENWQSFMTPSHEVHQMSVGVHVTRKEKLTKMVKEYVNDHTTVLSNSSVPFTYWLSKLHTWTDLSLYALEVLACPAASVLSERVFSSAGAIITATRTRLSTDNADRLTLIKFNKSWISSDFETPIESSPK